jgi:hypothetical protein
MEAIKVGQEEIKANLAEIKAGQKETKARMGSHQGKMLAKMKEATIKVGRGEMRTGIKTALEEVKVTQSKANRRKIKDVKLGRAREYRPAVPDFPC